jgi:hypothetical protein
VETGRAIRWGEGRARGGWLCKLRLVQSWLDDAVISLFLFCPFRISILLIDLVSPAPSPFFCFLLRFFRARTAYYYACHPPTQHLRDGLIVPITPEQYIDPDYAGGGYDEYFGDKAAGSLDCHSPDSSWVLLGVYRQEFYQFIEQISKHLW